MRERRRIEIQGVVQGVGFRPFVHRLATRLDLAGFVLNSTHGVMVEIEGEPSGIAGFVDAVREDRPPLAWVDCLSISVLAPLGETAFRIAPSNEHNERHALISADTATCPQCRGELFDPANRRFRYPFINCTNCGPRFTIVKELPYDRERSTMAQFTLCEACRREFEDPADRRFHAQAIACAECGPTVRLLDHQGREVTASDTIRQAADLLRQGAIVAVKGLGGFHLACSTLDSVAVAKLRRRKHREGKPFAIMAPDTESVKRLCWISPGEESSLCSSSRPIVLLRKRQPSEITPEVAPAQNFLGVMLPYTPLHHLLLEALHEPLVMTSGNLSEEPICRTNDEALRRLGAVADYFLVHDRGIHMRCDDSVMRCVSGRRLTIRRSRGYAPRPIFLARPFTRPVLACGAQLKNTFCLGKERYAFLSHHIGDLENYETLEAFVEAVDHYKRLFDVAPEVIAHDLHPQYLSARYADEHGSIRRIAVQHHHAHIAGCMAEHHLDGPVIGVALDGLGYGADGAMWGGEFLLASLSDYQRRAHFRYVPLAGGDTAIRQPWRSALAYLIDAAEDVSTVSSLAGWNTLGAGKVELVRSMIRQRIHTAPTSSCGRLFDAVASLLGIRHESAYEGQAAIELEAVAAPGINTGYEFVIGQGRGREIDFRPAIKEIVDEVKRKTPVDVISAKFHNTVIEVITEVCRRLRETDGVDRVCLSGGTFQNVYLLERIVPRLQVLGFQVFHPLDVPPNDGGIALGQAVVADALLREGG